MKGDLHTLKRICEYASKVMFAGIFAVAALLIATLVLGIGSVFSDGMGDILRTVTGLDSPEDLATWAALFKIVAILALGIVTVYAVYLLMVSVRDEHSPFNDRNTGVIILLSKIYLVMSVVLLALSAAASDSIAMVAFVFFGCILISVVLYCFALIVRYGAVLQDESDHTL
ncbi:MAG: hypothetical protein E7Z63_02260 [Thermoplasmata archaeon]|nr:hypothetical protein [Thermoplasmata archaeon]